MVPVDDHFYQLFFRGLVASTCANGDLRTLLRNPVHNDAATLQHPSPSAQVFARGEGVNKIRPHEPGHHLLQAFPVVRCARKNSDFESAGTQPKQPHVILKSVEHDLDTANRVCKQPANPPDAFLSLDLSFERSRITSCQKFNRSRQVRKTQSSRKFAQISSRTPKRQRARAVSLEFRLRTTYPGEPCNLQKAKEI